MAEPTKPAGAHASGCHDRYAPIGLESSDLDRYTGLAALDVSGGRTVGDRWTRDLIPQRRMFGGRGDVRMPLGDRAASTFGINV